VGGGNSFRGERRKVVRVDQVVRDAGVVGKPRRERLVYRSGVGLALIGLVVRVGRKGECGGVEDRGFLVAGIATGNVGHRVAVGEDACALVGGRDAVVE